MKIIMDITENDIKQSLLKNIDFRERVGQDLYREFINTTFDEIKSEFIEIARETMEDLVKEYVTNYYEVHTIKQDVEREMAKLTKSDLLELLKSRLV